ncbi:hypothetical protein SRABI83_01031 [Arthrobacter sp. Bi83]|uniref:peptidoglycan-binding protein n=1 Tax=Arthrobacter sp. Bi83 TaxID=2822353 RepID=UPI001DA2E4D9|nr:peptidoglycan-binding protein [Arthrobacter sp. Bi83]CAH0164343.1 hypothetical protein SRABI83_01031 [Arthrobacter sp. Bi83]
MNQQEIASQHRAAVQLFDLQPGSLHTGFGIRVLVLAGVLLVSATAPIWSAAPAHETPASASQPVPAALQDDAMPWSGRPGSVSDMPASEPAARPSPRVSAAVSRTVPKKTSASSIAAKARVTAAPHRTAPAAKVPVRAPAPAPAPVPARAAVAAPARVTVPVPAAAPAKPAPPQPAPAPVPLVRTIYVAGAGGQAMVDQCIGPIHYTPDDGYSLFITEHDFCGGWARFSGIQVGERVDVPGYGTYTVAARGQVPNGGTTNDVAAVFGGFPRAVLQTCIPGTTQMLVIALN